MSNIYNIFSQQRRVGAQLFGEEETDAATDIEQPTVVPYSSKAPLGKSVDDALRDMKLRDAMNTKLGDVGGGTQMPPDNTGNIYDDGNITAIGNAEKPLEEVQNGTNQTATPETTMSKAATTEPSATNAGSSDYQFASPELQNKAEKEWKKLMKDEYAVSKVTDILEKNLEGKDRQNKFVYKTELAKALKEYGVPGMEDKPTSGVYKTSKELTINGKPLEDDSKIGMLPTTKLVIDKWAKENPDAPIPPVTEYTNTMKQTNPNEVVRYNGNDYVTNIQQAQDYVDKLARMRASVNPTDTKVKGLQGINNWDEYQGYLADKAKVEEYNKNLNSAGGQYTGSDLAFQMKKKKLVDEVLLYDSTNGQKGISYDQWNNVQGGENITTADGRLIAMPVSTFSGGGKKGEKMEMPKKVEPVIVDIIGTATAKTVTDNTNGYSNGGGTADKPPVKLDYEKIDQKQMDIRDVSADRILENYLKGGNNMVTAENNMNKVFTNATIDGINVVQGDKVNPAELKKAVGYLIHNNPKFADFYRKSLTTMGIVDSGVSGDDGVKRAIVQSQANYTNAMKELGRTAKQVNESAIFKLNKDSNNEKTRRNETMGKGWYAGSKQITMNVWKKTDPSKQVQMTFVVSKSEPVAGKRFIEDELEKIGLKGAPNSITSNSLQNLMVEGATIIQDMNGKPHGISYQTKGAAPGYIQADFDNAAVPVILDGILATTLYGKDPLWGK